MLVRNIVAGPFEGCGRRICPRSCARSSPGSCAPRPVQAPGHYDLIHSHYWLSGQAGLVASEHWGVPLVHTAHAGRGQERRPHRRRHARAGARRIGEQQIVDAANRLVVNTIGERDELVGYYDADPADIDIVPPGADLEQYTPGTRRGTEKARRALGLAQKSEVIAFVGRIQPLKAPDVLVRALAEIVRTQPHRDVRLLVVGGPSGSGLDRPRSLMDLADELGVTDRVSFLAPRPPSELVDVYRAADIVAVPSYSESFGLVALEAQACGTPVVPPPWVVCRRRSPTVAAGDRGRARSARVGAGPRIAARRRRAAAGNVPSRAGAPPGSAGIPRPTGCWPRTRARWPHRAPRAAAAACTSSSRSVFRPAVRPAWRHNPRRSHDDRPTESKRIGDDDEDDAGASSETAPLLPVRAPLPVRSSARRRCRTGSSSAPLRCRSTCGRDRRPTVERIRAFLVDRDIESTLADGHVRRAAPGRESTEDRLPPDGGAGRACVSRRSSAAGPTRTSRRSTVHSCAATAGCTRSRTSGQQR